MNALIKHKAVGRRGADGEYIVRCRVSHKAHATEEESAEDRAKRILDQAVDESERLVAQARAEADDIRAEAYREGKNEAEAELEQMRTDMTGKLAEIEQQAAEQVERFWQSVEPDLLKLAVEIARKIVRREVERDDSFMLDAIKAGLHQLSNRHELKIRISPADSSFLREHKDELQASFDGISSVEVIEDRRVSQGGWLVESPNGRVDGRIESQLKEVDKNLLESFRDGRDQRAS